MAFLENYLQQLESIGLLNHLDSSQHYQLESKVMGMQSMIAADIMNLIPNQVIDIRNRKAESIDDYLPLLDELTTLSGDVFTYTELTVESMLGRRNRKGYLFRFTSHGTSIHGQVLIFSNSAYSGVNSFIRAANWALAEANIEDRFHMMATINEHRHTFDYGIICLTSDQRELLQKLQYPSLPYLYSETHITTNAMLKQWLKELEDSGLLDNMSQAEKDKILSDLDPPQVSSAMSLLYKMPDIAYTFDTEYFFDLSRIPQSYTELVNNIAKLTQGEFIPENIVVHRDTGDKDNDYRPVHMEFEFNGKHYEDNLEYLGDWVDVNGLVRLLHHALADNDLSRRFYGIDTGDQGTMLIYLSSAQVEQIQNSDLFKVMSFIS